MKMSEELDVSLDDYTKGIMRMRTIKEDIAALEKEYEELKLSTQKQSETIMANADLKREIPRRAFFYNNLVVLVSLHAIPTHGNDQFEIRLAVLDEDGLHNANSTNCVLPSSPK